MHDLYSAHVLDDGVENPVVGAASRVQANRLVTQGLANPSGFSTSGGEDELAQAVAILSGSRGSRGQLERWSGFGRTRSRDPAACFDVLVGGETLRCRVCLAFPDRLHGARSAEDLQRFLERGKVIGGDHHGCWVAMSRDRDSVMGALDVSYVLRKPVAGLA